MQECGPAIISGMPHQVTRWRNEGYTAIAVARYTGAKNGQSERLISSNGGNYIFGFHGQQTNRHHFDGWIDQGGTDPTIDEGSHCWLRYQLAPHVCGS